LRLSEIIEGMEFTARSGEGDPVIGKISFDSRTIDQGDLFVAIRGAEADGHLFMEAAIKSGAVAVVCESPGDLLNKPLPLIVVIDSRRALAQMASAFYAHPSEELSLVGVTGTNGKTTIATLLHQLHQLMGFKAGLLSTIQVLVGEASRPATHTTPDPLQINAALREMVDAGCEYCFMEVSSHAIDQERCTALAFNGGIFTNLSREHLDYHGDFKSYLEVKKRFFDHLPEDAFALVNMDDRNGKVMLQNCKTAHHYFSLRSLCDFRGRIREMLMEGSFMEINEKEIWLRLTGKFNAANLLAVYGAAILLGHHSEDVAAALSELKPVEGRFETFRSEAGTMAIVDYAHTPDALKNVLDTIHEVNVAGGEIICVVGAGGNRDRGKRPLMAEIAAGASHKVILTSDNPRDEDPELILDEMMAGVPKHLLDHTMRIASRQEAIRTACIIAGNKDIILVAGKGHEKSQEIAGVKQPFDDMQILKQHLKGEQ
jgi:UDP-N-acetylmuramoyl-L-alanyl-D-glutamate--2,6-diaminopimelate ligase